MAPAKICGNGTDQEVAVAYLTKFVGQDTFLFFGTQKVQQSLGDGYRGVPWVTTGRKRMGGVVHDHVNLGHGQACALCQALHCVVEVGELPGCKWLRPVQGERDFVGVEIRNKVHHRSNDDGHEQAIASANVVPCQEQEYR